MRTVRAFSAEHRICDNYGGDIDVTYNLGKKLALLSGVFQGNSWRVSGVSTTIAVIIVNRANSVNTSEIIHDHFIKMLKS